MQLASSFEGGPAGVEGDWMFGTAGAGVVGWGSYAGAAGGCVLLDTVFSYGRDLICSEIRARE